MWNTKKRLAMMTSAMILALASVGSITAFAEEEPATTTTEITSTAIETTTAISTETTTSQHNSEDIQAIVDEAVENSSPENSAHDYYSDNYYDTDGNATLIRQEKIIYDSEEMQFIAVTTKDGDVFYILINYSAENEENNVYFLNKVDDFDLYSLLYASDEEDVNPVEQASYYADVATGGNVQKSTESTAENNIDDAETTEIAESVKSSVNSSYLLIGGVAVLAVIVAVIFMLKSGKKKATPKTEDFDEDYDDDYGDVTEEDE